MDKSKILTQGAKEIPLKIRKILKKNNYQKMNKLKSISPDKTKTKANGIVIKRTKINRKKIKNNNKLSLMSKSRIHGKKVEQKSK